VQASDWENVPGLWAVAAGAAAIVLTRVAIRFIRRIRARPRELGMDRAAIVSLSEDLQQRIINEQRGSIGTPQVLAWDAPAYRLARRRLRSRNQDADLQSSLLDLDEARADLRAAWRFSKAGSGAHPEDLEIALRAHATAIEQFADASAIFVRISWQRRRSNGTAA
jgi:hypothetical protein